ncbi:XrtA system polysaccharide deacetylase [Sphingoaurantiacus capsulatus]|uniref:Chitooligosaccharide deacetylase n=1 Tax=Sphingoaurantiacus capsulatus TaxID=1771310 RepID=A0ABV7XFW4_9SPHN
MPPIVNAPIVNAMSVDIEEYFQVGAFEHTIDRSAWDAIASRVEFNTQAVLDLYAGAGVKATFFTLGWVAERHPALIRRIVAEGHELASHGYTHDRVHDLTPESFRADLRKTKAILEDAGGVPVIGYRAPSFSIGKVNAWALQVLADEGYAYSSSVAPFGTDHYGWPGFPRFAHRPVQGSPMIEVPVTTARFAGRTLAAGGGGFFRMLPYAFSRWAIAQVNEEERQPAVFYFHPWEVDPGQPRVAGAPIKSRLRHYTNLGVMADKLRRVMRDFAWDRMDRVYLGAPAVAAAA